MNNKYIKNRNQFLKENNDIKSDALHILATHDDGQQPGVKIALDKLDIEKPGNSVRVRFGPSPTGKLHIGGIRTALYNYLFAKQNGGIFYLRIEDTDRKRFDPEAEEYIKKSLEWCGIEPDESPWKPGKYGPYRQSERDYSKHIKYLIDNGLAYYAFDTEVDLNNARKANQNFAYDAKSRMSMRNSLTLPKEEVDKLLSENTPKVIRFKITPGETVSMTDIIRGKISVNSDQIDDKVLVKSDGIPTYHMASICDDHDMATSHVIRGEEWLPSLPFHVLLYKAFGWEPPQYAHLPLILNPDGKGKLSKRHSLKYGFPVFTFGGEGTDETGKKVAYKGFHDEGYEPEAVINFLCLLGWSPGDNKEMMTIAEMISSFDLFNVKKSGAKFDIEKSKWFNQQYLKGKTPVELIKSIEQGTEYSYTDAEMDKIVDMCKERSVFAKDLQAVADIFFKPFVLTDAQKSSIVPEFKTVFQEFIKSGEPQEWIAPQIKQTIFDICAKLDIKMGKIMPSLRVAIAGGLSGPDLMSSCEILGLSETIKRIEDAL